MSNQPVPGPEDEQTRGQEFAKWVLEVMNKPVSPERQDYEAQKEQKDRESMTHFYRLTRQLKATVPEAVSTLALVPSNSLHLRAVVLTVFMSIKLSYSPVWLTCGTNEEMAGAPPTGIVGRRDWCRGRGCGDIVGTESLGLSRRSPYWKLAVIDVLRMSLSLSVWDAPRTLILSLPVNQSVEIAFRPNLTWNEPPAGSKPCELPFPVRKIA